MRHDVHETPTTRDLTPDFGWTRPRPRLIPSENGPGEFTLRDMCTEFGLTPRALRFYESRGLISPRRDGPARVYGHDDRERIALILKGKKLGFTLTEISRLLADRAGEGADSAFRLSREQCVEQINLLERQKREIETALTELRRAYSSHYIRALDEGSREAG